MTDNNNPSIPNLTVGTNTNGDHEVDGDALMNELKSENSALKATVQVLQTEKQQFAEKVKQYEKEIDGFKMENQTLTEENKAFEEKLKKSEEMIQMNQQNLNQIENQSMVPIHEMKIQLPLENWHDLLALVPRSQLGNVVSQIGDRQFAYIIQSFLHDPVREITLGEMQIIPPRPNVSSDQPMVKVERNEATNMPVWPMPGNIKNFVEIDLNYVDMSALNFLQKFHENSLLSNVNLGFGYYRDRRVLLKDLNQIVPLVISIDSINSPYIDLLDMIYSNNNNNYGHMNDESSQLLLTKMMAMTRILAIELDGYDWDQWKDQIDWCCSWLYIPRDDGRPRMLISRSYNDSIRFSSLIERIKKDFEMANHPVSYFIRVRISGNVQPDYISFDNAKTNEKLVIKTKHDDRGRKMLLISRYPLNAAKNWIEANESEWNTSKLNRKIYVNIDGVLTTAM